MLRLTFEPQHGSNPQVQVEILELLESRYYYVHTHFGSDLHDGAA